MAHPMIVGVKVKTDTASIYQPRRSLATRLMEWQPRHYDRLRVQFSDASEKLGPALLILYHASPSNSFPVSLGVRPLNKRNNVAKLHIVLGRCNVECFQPGGSNTHGLSTLPVLDRWNWVENDWNRDLHVSSRLDRLGLVKLHREQFAANIYDS